MSLGCPKALVDSERILTRLRAEGYEVAASYRAADLVVVNTCGFIDAAVDESLDAIGEALAENGKVIVTGCLGAQPQKILDRHPQVLKITGPQRYEEVVASVHEFLPPKHEPFLDLDPGAGGEADAAPLMRISRYPRAAIITAAFASSPRCAGVWSAGRSERCCARLNSWCAPA